MKASRRNNEMTQALDEPERIDLKERDEAHTQPLADTRVVVAEEYTVKVSIGSNGFYNAGVKTKGNPRPGESIKDCAERLNRFCVTQARAVETVLKETGDQ